MSLSPRTTATLAAATLALAACSGDTALEPPTTGGSDVITSTPRSPATATSSASPDASDPAGQPGALAYIDRRADQSGPPVLVVREAPDAAARPLFEGATEGTAWAPSGDRLSIIARTEGPDGEPTEELIVVEVASGTSTRLATGNFTGPTWSPDGTTIAVGLNGGGSHDGIAVATVDATSGALTVVTDPPSGSDDLHATWSPDGSRIAFTRNAHPGPDEGADDIRVLTVDAAGGDIRERSSDLFSEGAIAWTPDGSALAITAATAPGQPAVTTVRTLELDGTTRTRFDVSGVQGTLAFAPDGGRLALTAGATVGETDIVILDATTGERLVTFDEATYDIDPSWSPDGTHLVFLAAPGLEGSADLALVEVDAGAIRRLTDGAAIDAPAFAVRR